jgi:hypothetical protein
MATWQFDFHFLPAEMVRRRYGAVPVTMTREDLDDVTWWEGFEQRDGLEAEVSRFLPRSQSWSADIQMWGDEDGDRFDVCLEAGRVVSVFGRVDVRRMSLPFLSSVVELARKLDLLILTQDNHVLRPSFKELVSAIRRSSSFRFVRDPEGFLKELAKRQ